MNIHIHRLGIHLQEQDRQRVAPYHQQSMVGLQQGSRQGGILNGAAIDEENHLAPVRAGQAGWADKAGHPQVIFLRNHLQHLARHFNAIQRSQHLAPVAIPAGHQCRAAILIEVKTHFWVCQGITGDQLINMAALGAILLQEFQAGRHIVEQVFHPHHRSNRRAHLLQLPHMPALHPQARRRVGRGRPRSDGQARHRADRGQRLAAKTQRGNAEQVGGALQLAGGVPFYRQRQLASRDAAAIIGNLDLAFARSFDMDGKLAGPSIQGVFQQFFNGRGRALNDFAGRNL